MKKIAIPKGEVILICPHGQRTEVHRVLCRHSSSKREGKHEVKRSREEKFRDMHIDGEQGDRRTIEKKKSKRNKQTQVRMISEIRKPSNIKIKREIKEIIDAIKERRANIRNEQRKSNLNRCRQNKMNTETNRQRNERICNQIQRHSRELETYQSQTSDDRQHSKNNVRRNRKSKDKCESFTEKKNRHISSRKPESRRSSNYESTVKSLRTHHDQSEESATEKQSSCRYVMKHSQSNRTKDRGNKTTPKKSRTRTNEHRRRIGSRF